MRRALKLMSQGADRMSQGVDRNSDSCYGVQIVNRTHEHEWYHFQ